MEYGLRAAAETAPCTNDLQVHSSKVMSSPLPHPWVRLLLPTSLLEPAHFVPVPHFIHLQNGWLSLTLGLLEVTRRWGSCFKPLPLFYPRLGLSLFPESWDASDQGLPE